jgi:XTP/dITP diphosphohydrolase
VEKTALTDIYQLMKEIVLATSNGHKVSEYRALFKKAGLEIDVLSLRDFPNYHLPDEIYDTFEGNVKLKAEHAGRVLQKLVIADDSGLVVPGIEGKPGVHSARYAGPNATDKDNRTKLLKEMKGLRGLERTCYFECWIAMADGNGIRCLVNGRCEGELTEEERGGNGFGYDPLFLRHDWNKTFAEIDEKTKNRVSHRFKAFEKLLIQLEKIQLNDLSQGKSVAN